MLHCIIISSSSSHCLQVPLCTTCWQANARRQSSFLSSDVHMDLQGNANAELYEGLLMLQHRGQDSAGMVTSTGDRFHEHKANGLVKDVFSNQRTMDKLTGRPPVQGQGAVNTCLQQPPDVAACCTWPLLGKTVDLPSTREDAHQSPAAELHSCITLK